MWKDALPVVVPAQRLPSRDRYTDRQNAAGKLPAAGGDVRLRETETVEADKPRVDAAHK